MGWQRRRRHRFGLFYVDTNRFVPTSWGVHEGPATYNVTRHRGSVRLPEGLGSWTVGGRHHQRRGSRVTGIVGWLLITTFLVVAIYYVGMGLR